MALKCWCKRDNLEENKVFKKLKDKKGFTLVELIVVLVILAILAALLVPALTGYIDRANEEKVIAEARMALMAAQTQGSIEYAKAPAGAEIKLGTAEKDTDTDGVITYTELNKLCDITLSDTNLTTLTYKDGKVDTMKYVASGYTATYDTTNGLVAAKTTKAGG
jgi:prepilin-type N-terminal cleavage/methylation domain-containing protein